MPSLPPLPSTGTLRAEVLDDELRGVVIAQIAQRSTQLPGMFDFVARMKELQACATIEEALRERTARLEQTGSPMWLLKIVGYIIGLFSIPLLWASPVVSIIAAVAGTLLVLASCVQERRERWIRIDIQHSYSTVKKYRDALMQPYVNP